LQIIDRQQHRRDPARVDRQPVQAMRHRERRVTAHRRWGVARLALKSGQRPVRRSRQQRIPFHLPGASEQRLKQLPRNPERKPAFKLPAGS
jgi:hypothetical protein